jgi:hypothetical protein
VLGHTDKRAKGGHGVKDKKIFPRWAGSPPPIWNDPRIPPANHLETLSGDRAGQYSIRINDQWRLCFVWNQGQAERVEICDLH